MDIHGYKKKIEFVINSGYKKKENEFVINSYEIIAKVVIIYFLSLFFVYDLVHWWQETLGWNLNKFGKVGRLVVFQRSIKYLLYAYDVLFFRQ